MGIKKFKTLVKVLLVSTSLFLLTALTAPIFVFAASPVVDLTSSATAQGQPGPCPSFIISGKYCLLTGKVANIPAEINIRDGGLSLYLNQLYKVGVAAATGLALIYITIGGLQYSTTDSVTGSSKGRETITNALVGLLVVLASYVMLNAINPALLNSDLPIGGDPTRVGQNAVAGNTSGIQIVNPGTSGGNVLLDQGSTNIGGRPNTGTPAIQTGPGGSTTFSPAVTNPNQNQPTPFVQPGSSLDGFNTDKTRL